MDKVREALQDICDAEGSGWQVAHYVMMVGGERMGEDGETESTVWVGTLKSQPEYITDGLIGAALQLRSETVEDDYC